jgi:glyoxylase-like metal-dependent hydrolase (beta-lactamase superfamily II)
MQSSLGVHPVSIMPWGMVNAFIVSFEGKSLIVDTGLPGSAPKFAAVLRRIGQTFSDVRLIVVTHGHVDHAGAALELRKLTGAPVLAHADECCFLCGERPMTFCPTGAFGRWFLKTRAPLTDYPRFTPDIIMTGSEPFELGNFGVPGSIEATPGHTPGSLSVLLSGAEALVGDMLASGILLGGIVRKGTARRPPFEEQPAQVGRQLLRLVDGGYQRFYLGHGGPLKAREVLRHARKLAELK